MALLGNLQVKDFREKVVVDNKALRKQRYVNEKKQKLRTLSTCFSFYSCTFLSCSRHICDVK